MKKSPFKNMLCIIIAVILLMTCIPAAYSTNANSAADAFVQQAVSQIGYYEESNGTTKYGIAFGNPKLEKWDVAFVAWCANETGITSDIIPNYTDVTALQNFFKLKGVYKKSAAYDGEYIPKAGDIAFLSLEGSQYSLSSVGIVEATELSDVFIIEGNCPNRVRKNSYKMDSKNIIGYATPKFTAIASAPSTTSKTPVAETYKTGTYITNDDMNFRVSNSTSAALIEVVPANTTLLIDSVKDGWGHTTYNDNKGWLSLEYSTFTGDGTSNYETGVYRTNFIISLHKNTSEGYDDIINSIPKGTIITVTKVLDEWGKTSINGQEGWLLLKYCTPFSSENDEPVIVTKPTIPTADTAVDWLVVDISVFNDPDDLDWETMKKAGVKGAIIRIGGRFVVSKELYDDIAFYQHYKNAKAAGLHVGAYFFSYAMNKRQAVEEAQMTINILKANNCKLDMPVYIDIEDYTNDWQHENAGKAVCTKVVNAFCKTIEDAGYYSGIYANKFFAEELIDHSAFEGRSLWLAHYASECGYKDTPVNMWQYTPYGSIRGYYGTYIDMNRCYVNYPAIINGTLSPVTPPENTTVEMPTHSEPNSTPAGGPETTTEGNSVNRDPTILREWETTKQPTCTADGIQNMFSGEQLLMKRYVAAEHSKSAKCILTDNSAELHAGDTFVPNDNSFINENDDLYAEAYSKIRSNGGCAFQYCTTCFEITKVEYFYRTTCKHAYDKSIISAATCTEEGIENSVCSICGKTGCEEITPRAEHTPGEVVLTEGINGSPAYYGISCDICGAFVSASYTYMRGDVNGDGHVDASDARLTLRHSVKLENIAPVYLNNADMNKDKVIDATDARLILRKSVGLEQ